MKISFNLALVTLLTLLVPVHGQEPRVVRRVTVNKTSLDFADHLQGKAEWRFENDRVLSLKMEGDSTVFQLNGVEELFRLDAPEYVDEAVVSDDGQTLLLKVMKTRGFGSDFATLIRVRAVDPKLNVDRILQSGTKVFGDKRWWMADLGAVSNDGGKVLARFGVDSPDTTGIGYHWYTVELPSGKILSEGLTIANSKAPDE